MWGDTIITILNKIMWAIATSLLLMSGIYFTFKLKFIQFDFKSMLKALFKKNNNKNEISSFKALMMALGGRLGVGSIAGVALAINLGGVGTIFWMWIVAFITGANTFVENILANIYKEKDTVSINKGGPSYYIKKGLGFKKTSVIYSLLIIIGYMMGMSAIQSNTISKATKYILNLDSLIIGIIIAIFTYIIIFKGVKIISNSLSKIVPIMTLLYLLCMLYSIGTNLDLIIPIIKRIISEALAFKPFFSGFLPMVIIGIQRGIFSNESGIGTSTIVSSTTKGENIINEGYVQTIGIYFTTMIICTATAFIILTTDYDHSMFNNINGIEVIQYAFTYHFGEFGKYIITVIIFLFTFSTIITASYYGESSIKFLSKKISNLKIVLIRFLSVVSVFLGAIASSLLLWNLVDYLISILVIINISSIILLRDQVIQEIRYYKS